MFAQGICELRHWGRVVFVPVLQFDTKLLLSRFLEPNSDALNLQIHLRR